jgi:hypothetical protein
MSKQEYCQRCAHPEMHELGQLVSATVGTFRGLWHFPCLAAARREWRRALGRPLERR